MSHSFILEQVCSGVPREWVHLCLILVKDFLPFCVVGLCCPPGLACPSFCYQQVVCSNGSYITHSSPSATITQVLNLPHMLPSWVHDTTYSICGWMWRVRYVSEENKCKKWFKRPELGMILFRLTALKLGLVCSYFLVTRLALLFFLFLTNTRHPRDDRAEDSIIFKG
jgi:hypothetical protein